MSASFNLSAQVSEDNFKNISIAIGGEEVFGINAMVQDKQGYIWMSTNLGLLKYDGYKPKVYKNVKGDSTSLHNNDVTTLFVDFTGDLWVGANDGLSRYNNDCDCFFRYPSIYGKTIPSGYIRSIVEDQNNNIWIAAGSRGLFRYDRESDGFTQFLSDPSDSTNLTNDVVRILLADRNDNLWIGTGKGLLRFNLKTEKAKGFIHDTNNPNSLLDNRISALHEDLQGRILVGTSKSGLHIYNSESDNFDRKEFDASHPNQLHASYSEDKVRGNDPSVNFIHQDHKGNYWIGTTGKGINYFDTVTNKVTFYPYNAELQREFRLDMVSSFLEGNQGELWFGSSTKGLFMKDLFARKFMLHREFGSVSPPYESPINQGTIWVTCQGGGFGKLDLKTNKVTKFLHNDNDVQSIGHTWSRSAYQENSNVLWVGLGYGGKSINDEVGDGGLDRMDIKTGTFKHFEIIKNDDTLGFSETVFQICEDKQGRLWLGAGSGGLFRSDIDKKEFKQFNFPRADSISINPVIYDLQVDAKGVMWASDSKYGGLYKYDESKDKFTLFLEEFIVLSIVEDKNGWFWLSTFDNGILHLNPADGSYKQYTKKEGLKSNLGNLIIEGNEEGVYWIASRFGPSKMDARTGKITPVNIPMGRYNIGGFKSVSGKLFFPANKGLVSFYPDEIMGNPFPPQMLISDFLISGVSYKINADKSKEIVLSYNQNDLSFKYVGIHFTNSSKNLYQYKLTPVDDDWVEAGKERIARYNNLAPGIYTFQVKAANSDGVWNKDSTSVQFVIKPAWWSTWWAYIIYMVLLAAIVYRLYRFQLSRKLAVAESKQLKEVNTLKNSLYTNITHEFRTPLTVILGMADALKSDAEKEKFQQAEKPLELIQRNGESLLTLVNEMLDLSKLESGNMELELGQSDVIPYIKYLCESFHSLAEEKGINFTVYAEIDALVMDFDANKLATIISNLLSNAIKFTLSNGKIIVHLSQTTKNDRESLSIKIKDNGVGLSEDESANIFDRFYQVDNSSLRKNEGTGIGLALTRELVVLMEGTIAVKSMLGNGSEFIVNIPVSRNSTVMKGTQISVKVKNSGNPFVQQPIVDLLENSSELPLVLIIEDNEDVAHYLKTCLQGKYQTIHAINGKLGIEMAYEKIPDIIITDVMMPEKDGYEVCEVLKSDERTDHIPIIILTAKVTMKDRLTGLSHGADAYLAKPFLKAELFTRLDQLILQRKKMIDKMERGNFSQLLTRRVEDPETKFLQKIVKIIHEDISNDSLGAIHLVRKLHLSESQIYRKLKAITGKSIALFIRSVRLQKSKELIQSTEKTISEIAYEVGFNDPSWFSRAFKEEFGFTPNDLRK